MAREVTALGLGRLGLAGLTAFTPPTNRASRRVTEKAGFGYERDTVHAGCRTCSTACRPLSGGTPRTQ